MDNITLKGKNSADMARVYMEKGNYTVAISKFTSWLRKYPTDKAAWLDYGACLYHEGRLDSALAATRRCMELDSSYPLAHNNIGLYYQMKNDGTTAAKWYKKAGDAGYTDAYFNYALSLLKDVFTSSDLNGLQDAWEWYDWRFKKSSPVCLPRVPPHMKKGWDGVSPVMVLTEQGIGDTIMFSRYVDLLPKGSKFAVPEDLLPVFAGRDFDMITDTTLAGDITQWIPMAELVKTYGVIPGPSQVNRSGGGIGVCWQGNKEHSNDKNRSYPELRREMLKLPGAVNLQFGDNKDITSWNDTLKLLEGCSKIVTIDSSLAHLGGYLGIETLVLMPTYDWDFRWGTGKTNHWYPSVTAYATWKDLLKDL